MKPLRSHPIVWSAAATSVAVAAWGAHVATAGDPGPSQAPEASALAHTSASEQQAAAPSQPARPIRATISPGTPIEPPKFIKNIELDRVKVCANQSVVARAELTADASPGMTFGINGEVGAQVMLRPREPGPMRLLAVARYASGEVAETSSRVVQVERCPGAPRLELVHRISSSHEDAVVVEGRAIRGLEPPLRWSWEFGDGHELVKQTSPRAVHSYRLRPQTGPSSRFVLTATATDARGVSARGHAVVQLANAEWMLSRQGIWHHPVEFDRFAQFEDGVLRAPFRARNLTTKQPFKPQEVTAKLTACDGRGSRKARRLDVPASQALNFDQLPPGKIFDGVLKLDVPNPQRWCRWNVEVRGVLEDGSPSTMSLAFEHDAPSWVEPTRDPEAIKRAMRARVRARNKRREVSGEQLRAPSAR